MLTEDLARLQKAWPRISPKAERALRRRGVSAPDAEDAVSEAVARLIRQSVEFTDDEDLLRWLHTVSWRIVIDRRRRDGRLVYETPDLAAKDNTATSAVAAVRVGRLRRLMRNLQAGERAVLFGDGVPQTRKESVRLAVQRHRLRNRLRRDLDGLAILPVGLLPRWWNGRGARVGAAALAAPAMAASLVALPPPGAPHGLEPPASRGAALIATPPPSNSPAASDVPGGRQTARERARRAPPEAPAPDAPPRWLSAVVDEAASVVARAACRLAAPAPSCGGSLGALGEGRASPHTSRYKNP